MRNLKLVFKDDTACEERKPEDDHEEVDDCFEVGNDTRTRPKSNVEINEFEDDTEEECD